MSSFKKVFVTSEFNCDASLKAFDPLKMDRVQDRLRSCQSIRFELCQDHRGPHARISLVQTFADTVTVPGATLFCTCTDILNLLIFK